MDSRKNVLPVGQEWFTDEIAQTFFPFYPGMCTGVTAEAVMRILSNNLQQFNSLFITLKKLSPIYDKFQCLIAKLSQYQSEIEKEELKPSQDITVIKREKLKLLHPDEKDLWEITKLFFGISLLQNPQEFEGRLENEKSEKNWDWEVVKFFNTQYSSLAAKEIFQRRPFERLRLLRFITPPELEKKGGVVLVKEFSGCYAPNELVELIRSLQKSLQTIGHPVALAHTSREHVIAEGIFPRNQPGIIADANALPAIEREGDEDRARNIASGLFDPEFARHTPMNTAVYATSDMREKVEENLAALFQQKKIQDILKVTVQKARIAGWDWLYQAVLCNESKTIEDLILLDVPLNQTSSRGVTLLYAAVIHGYFPAVRALTGSSVNINAAIWGDQTPVGVAVLKGYINIVKWLVALKVDLRKKCCGNSTLLELAKSSPVISKIIRDELERPRASLTEKLRFVPYMISDFPHYFYGDDLARMSSVNKAFHRIAAKLSLVNFINQDKKSEQDYSFADSYNMVRAFDQAALPEYEKNPDAKNDYLTCIKKNNINRLFEKAIKDAEETNEDDIFFKLLQFRKAMLQINIRQIRITLYQIVNDIIHYDKGFLIKPFLNVVRKVDPDNLLYMINAMLSLTVFRQAQLTAQVIEYMKENPREDEKAIFTSALRTALTGQRGVRQMVADADTVEQLLNAGGSLHNLVESEFEILKRPIEVLSFKVIELLLKQNIPEAVHQGDYVSVLLVRVLSRVENTKKHNLIDALFNYGARFKFENLRAAIKYGWFQLFEMLLQKMKEANVDINKPDDGKEPLIFSAETFDKLKILLQAGVNPNISNSVGCTPLMHFSSREDIKPVELLLEAKVDVNAQSAIGQTALIVSLITKKPAISRRLLEAGAKVEIKNPDGSYFPIVMQALKSSEAIDLLLKHKAEVNGKTAEGDTPLMLAIRYYDENYYYYPHPAESVRHLLEHKANVSARNNRGFSALGYALAFCLKNKRLEEYKEMKVLIVDLLKAGANPNDKTPDGKTSLAVALACYQNDTSPTLLESLLLYPQFKMNHADKKAITLATNATKSLEAMRLLLRHNANPNASNNKKVTSLMMVCDVEFGARAYKLVPLLLDAKADINAVDENQQTALFYRCKYIDHDTITLLLDRKSDIHHRDKDGNTPLLFTLINLTTMSDASTVNTLLDRNADLTAKNNQGESALDICKKLPESPWLSKFKENIEAIKQKRMDAADNKQEASVTSVVSTNNNVLHHPAKTGLAVLKLHTKIRNQDNSFFPRRPMSHTKPQAKPQTAQANSASSFCNIQ